MHGNIVQDEVDKSVSSYTKPHASHDAVSGVKSEIDSCRGGESEEEGEDVVQLKEALLRNMMGLMDAPEGTMHDILMKSPAKGFHSNKSHDC